MRRTLLGLFVSAAAAFLAHATADAQESNPAPPLAEQRGAFQTTLPERSPTSATAELAKRLNVKPTADAEYDLTKEQFWVYVPPDYDASQKYGLTVYLNYKGTNETPKPLHETFDQKHLIFVSPTNGSGRPDATQAGLALDAVHNLSKQFNVDPQRVYLIGATDASAKLAMNAGDVFTGDVLLFQAITCWKDLKLKSGRFFHATMPHPQGAAFGALKRHPVVIGDPGGDEAPGPLLQKALLAEGFKSVTFVPTTTEDAHYSNFKPEWFAKILEALDAAPREAVASGAPGADRASTPATQPAGAHAPAGAATGAAAGAPAPFGAPAAAAPPSDAQRMLKLAKSYIAANRFPQARERLQTIVDKFPTDPAAAEAKQLLEQIKGK